MESDEQQILKLFEAGDRALIAADLAELSRIFADDYMQYDQTGKSFTKQDMINNLKSRTIRYVSMISTGRRIRLLSEDLAIVHGSEERCGRTRWPTLPCQLRLHGCGCEAQ